MGGRRATGWLLLVMALIVSLAGCAIVDELLPPRPVMTREQAIAAAQLAEPTWADDTVIAAELGVWKDLTMQGAPVEGPQPDPVDAVWLVNLGWQIGPMNGQGVILVLDARDGHVIQRGRWIS
jgi:hypothetical protein